MSPITTTTAAAGGRAVRRVAVLLTAVVLTLSTAVGAAAREDVGPVPGLCAADPPAAAFTDRVAIDRVHLEAVDCLAFLGVVEGRPVDGGAAYLPEAPVRRDQMASFLVRALRVGGFEVPDPPGDVFDDVAAGNVHADAIAVLAGIDVTTGVRPGRYVPDRPVSRAEMATFLLRTYAYATDTALEDLTVGEPAFTDTSGLFHQPFIAGAEARGLVEGVASDRYEPAADVSREQMGTFVSRLLDRAFGFATPCANPTTGYTVVRPDSWSVNAGDVVEPCSVFDPAPFTLAEGTELPFDLAIRIRAVDRPFDDASSGDDFEDVVSIRPTTVAGRDAVVITAVATRGLIPAGTESYRYVIDRGDAGILVARTFDIGDAAYGPNRQVLDRMMATLDPS